MRPQYVLEIFVNVERYWWWRLRHRRNRRIVAIGGEPYASKANARRAFRALGLPAGTWEVAG